MQNEADKWSLACHLDFGGRGKVAVVERRNGKTAVHPVPAAPASGKAVGYRPVYLGVAEDGRRVLMMDPVSRAVIAVAAMPPDAAAHYAYPEAGTNRWWYTNDGDEETGSDPLCADGGATMTVIAAGASGAVEILKSICIGRGHHVPSFTAPSEKHPAMPRRSYVSNLQDGTISVLGNDPADKAGYLMVSGSINLCEPAKEKDGVMQAPNNAFPHGEVYSPVSGRVYNLNNGYGTVAVIDPLRNEIVDRVEFKGCSNLLLSPDGRYVIGKGADRKTDPDHVIGRLIVLDVVAGKVVAKLDLKDVYPSTYRFSPDGRRLYVTTAATGKGAQHANLKKSVVLVYDCSELPELRLLQELAVGLGDCGRRPIAFLRQKQAIERIFVPNPTDGTLSILDGAGALLETVRVSEQPITELNFSLLGADNIYGS
jgi:DNA-binding beta-propeller fold protein YncE